MKVLHAAALPRPSSGIISQMTWELESATALGLDWHVALFCPEERAVETKVVRFLTKPKSIEKSGFFSRVFDWLKFRVFYYRLLKNVEHKYDVLLLRHSIADPFQILFILSSSKPVYLVHHTLETYELRMSAGIINKMMWLLESLIGGLSIRLAHCVIGVTNEIANYEKTRVNQPRKKTLVYPNGIKYINSNRSDSRKNIPELLFISSYFYPWHGLDLLLDAAEKYQGEFILHLVGKISMDDSVRAKKDIRIKMHGYLSADEISRLSDSCWIGLSSFALQRNKMKEACTLKVREYLMLGLPVYAGYKDVFPDGFTFYRHGGIDFNEIVDYANSIRQHSRKSVAESSRPYIDKDSIIKTLYMSL